MFAMSGKELAKQIERRVGQCVLTCPTTAVFAGLDEGEPIALGKNLRFFGDGWQISKVIGGVRYWRVPVMDGEFVAQETTPVVKGVGGGNLLLLARDTDAALAAREAAVAAMRAAARRDHAVPRRRGALGLEGRQQVLDAAAPRPTMPSARACSACVATARSRRRSRCVLEIVIDGLTEADVAAAMRAGLSSLIDARCGERRARASRPATTAASWGRSISTCTSCCRQAWECAHMSSWTLQLRQPPALRVDMRGILPAALADMSAAQVERLPVLHGNERLRAGRAVQLVERVVRRRRPWCSRAT